jgi:hypothetical protein
MTFELPAVDQSSGIFPADERKKQTFPMPQPMSLLKIRYFLSYLDTYYKHPRRNETRNLLE